MKPRASSQKRGVFHLRGTPDAIVQPVRLLAFNKPYGVICQFTRDGVHLALADFIDVPDVYPAGRLDTDSEGLLLLTNHGPLQHWISNAQTKLKPAGARHDSAPAKSPPKPGRKSLRKTYWVQVEGEPTPAAIERLCAPLDLGDFTTQASQARRIGEPAGLWPRHPPIRHRALIPATWLEITLTEGKNRQVRRMTAKTGYPTLRLIRASIGPVTLNSLEPGQWRDVSLSEIGYSA